MSRRLRVRAIPKEEPNIGLYVLALIALAQQLQEAEQRTADETAATTDPDGSEVQDA
jgi:hypothetical protein